MNKVEFAVCRIRQVLPKNEGYLTRGSGCVVKCEWLSNARGWKCPYVVVTSSRVVHREELVSGKAFVADFLLKDKKGLETFDLKLAADTSADVLGRNVLDVTNVQDENARKGQSVTIISVEKLDKRGFLKRMTKKSSLQTSRPLECLNTADLNEELSEGLFCHVIREGKHEFSTRTYKFLFVAESVRGFVLQDFGSTEINSLRGFPNDEMPLGAVIYTKRGEFVGLLEFSEEIIEPCFLPVEERLSAEANGEQEDQAVSNNNASAMQASLAQADLPDKDDDKDESDEARNKEEGQDMMHTEDNCEKRHDAVETCGSDSNIAKHQVPFETSTGTTPVEAAHSTSGQTDISVTQLQSDDSFVSGLPIFQTSVVAENSDKVIVDVHTKGEDLAGSSSEQTSCDDSEGPKDEMQNTEVDIKDATGLDDEIAMSVGGEASDLKCEEDTCHELLENTSEGHTSGGFGNVGTSTSGESTLNTVAGTQVVFIDQNKADDHSRTTGEPLESTVASEEHLSSSEKTLPDELQSTHATELDYEQESENESTEALAQTSAESNTEVSREFQSDTTHCDLSDREPVALLNDEGEENSNMLLTAAPIKLIDEEEDSMTHREQSVDFSIPEIRIETVSDTHDFCKDSAEDILPTGSADTNVEEDKGEVRYPESSSEEPSEKLTHVEYEEKELCVEEVGGKVEEIGGKGIEEDEEDQGVRDEVKNYDEREYKDQDNEDKDGEREAKSTKTAGEKERFEQTEPAPAFVKVIEGRESDEDDPSREQDQEEDKVTSETDEGEEGETEVVDKVDKESEEKELKDEVMYYKKECEESEEVQEEEQASGKEAKERAERSEEKEEDEEEEHSAKMQNRGQKDEEEEEEDVQLQNPGEKDEDEQQDEEDLQLQSRGEKNEEKQQDEDDLQLQSRGEKNEEKQQDEDDLQLQNRGEKDEEEQQDEEDVQLQNRGEKDEEKQQDEEDLQLQSRGEKNEEEQQDEEDVQLQNRGEKDEEEQQDEEDVQLQNRGEKDEEKQQDEEDLQLQSRGEKNEEEQQDEEDVQLQNRGEKDEEEQQDEEDVQLQNRGEKDEEEQQDEEDVQLQNRGEKDEEEQQDEEDLQLQSRGEKNEEKQQDEEDVQLQNRGEKDEEKQQDEEDVQLQNRGEKDEEGEEEVEKADNRGDKDEEGEEEDLKVQNPGEKDEKDEEEVEQAHQNRGEKVEEEDGKDIQVHDKEEEDVDKAPNQGEKDKEEETDVPVHNYNEEEEVDKAQNQGEKDKEEETDVPVHNYNEEEEVDKAQNQGEKDKEEETDVPVQNYNEEEEVQEEEVEEVHKRGEKDEETERDGNEDGDPRERTVKVPLMKQEAEETEEEEEEDDNSDIVAQRIDADSLLSEIITNNSRILDDLARCLDTDYQYSQLPGWHDLADLLAIPPELYEPYDVYSVSSPTEDLFVFLSSTKPDLTMKDIRDALVEIGRSDVVQIMDRFRTRNLISNESVVGSLVEREDRDLLGKLALNLDRGSANTWKHLAVQLAIPRRVYRNFGSNQGCNSALLLLKYLPIFDPEFTIADLKEVLERILMDDVIAALDSARIPDDEHVRDILDDTELMDQITDLLNEEPPTPNWRHLARELKVPREKCQLFEPTQDESSCTKLLFRSIEKSEPDTTVEELILALVAMKRQDVLDVLAKYLDGEDIDSILEENNLVLAASNDNSSEDDTAN